ncbi:hypothetical protein SUGI_0079080 [Cryptomeria japonica]|nr:hypothetical protein SUGI_0079080 [Cryptomeria japonica]
MVALMGKEGVVGQSSCTNVLSSLSPCVNYILGTQMTPSQGCCDALASVVEKNAPCLCQLVTGNNSLGIAINQTRALALPSLCKVTTPPVSLCQGIPSPTAPSGNGSGVPTTETPLSSNPTHNNSASSAFVSVVLNVVTAVVFTAIVM